MSPTSRRRIAAVALPVALSSIAAVVTAGPSAATPATSAQEREQETQLISRSVGGGVPNGPSTNGVISNDRRWARVIAFQSDASDIVRGDNNGQTDVFAALRQGPVSNNGARWRARKTILISRGRGGSPANGRSFAPAVDGSFTTKPKCVAFLSDASNIARGDTNGVTDAFVSRGPGRVPKRVSLLPGNRKTRAAATRVAVSGDCSRIAFVAGGQLYVRLKGRRTKKINAPGAENDPSFSTGKRNDLVFGAGRGIYLSRGATKRPRLVARGGADPAFNDIKRQVVAYEKRRGGYTQIAARDLGRKERFVSVVPGRHAGNGNSRDPVIGNSGYYVTFETDADNLWINASRRTGDSNGNPDIYLYSDVRNLTLAESVDDAEDIVPGGGKNPSMAFYANYILWDSPSNLQTGKGDRQVFMRWLGKV
jgi:hypothetical protein